MFLVYEKNYNMDGDVDCVEGCDMKLFTNKEKALVDMKKRKEEYIDDNDFRYVLITPDSTPSGCGANHVRYVINDGSVGCNRCDINFGVRPFFVLKSSTFVS